MKKKRPVSDYRKWMMAFSLALILPYLANAAGWLMAEMGRYPWVVYGLQTMEDGVSVVTDPVSLLISLIGFVAVYTILAIADVYLIKRHGIKNPESDQEITSSIEGKGASLWT